MLAGDAFVLSFDKLKSIAIKIHDYLPGMQTITMYASMQNIFSKTVDELKILKTLGINYLYVGLESGDEKTLQTQDLKYTPKQALEQLKKLEEAGIGYLAAYILGAAGKGAGERNALESAKFFSQIKPDIIWTMNLIVMEGTPLFDDVQNGTFVEADELEKIQEFKLFLENLDSSSQLISAHGSNLVGVSGQLPNDKPIMIKALQKEIDMYDSNAMATKSANRRF